MTDVYRCDLHYAVICCQLLCCAVLCCAVPCCAVPCRAVPCRAVPCRAVPCRAVPCRAVPCRAVLCCAVLCCAVPCRAVLCCAVSTDCHAACKGPHGHSKGLVVTPAGLQPFWQLCQVQTLSSQLMRQAQEACFSRWTRH